MPLDLRASSKKLDTYHQRFLDDGFPDDLHREAFSSFDASIYDQEVLWRGMKAWQLRTLDEYRSQVAFTELLAQITELGMPFDSLGTCVRVIRDEARHVELCRRMVVALGGSDVIAGEPGWVRSDPRLPLRTRILRTAVGSLCCGETVSVRILTAVRNQTEDPLAQQVVTCLARDEAIHSRFGWTLLELIFPHLTNDERADLVAMLPFYMKAIDQAVLPPDAHLHEDAEPLSTGPYSPFGWLSPKDRAEVFYDALERDIIRRFEELGLPGRSAWEQRPR